MMDEYSAILFHSPNHAIWTAKLLTKEGIENRMIPIPRNLSSDCGYCVRIFSSDAERAGEVMKKNSIDYDMIEKI
jgi:hypothetical protein